tara:strand:- start:389 stop:628 length:240 start_codon:yes stop_codon:yes gene_type:complete
MESQQINICCEKCNEGVIEALITNPESYKRTSVIICCSSCNHKTEKSVIGDFSFGQLDGMLEIKDLDYDDDNNKVTIKV